MVFGFIIHSYSIFKERLLLLRNYWSFHYLDTWTTGSTKKPSNSSF